MIKSTVHQFKLLFLLLVARLIKWKKFVKFLLSGKHEIERICEDQVDIYDKALRVDSWLSQTNCKQIQVFLSKQLDKNENKSSLVYKTIHKVIESYQKSARSKKKGAEYTSIESIDLLLSDVLRDLTNDLMREILTAKRLQKISAKSKALLNDALYRFIAYKISLMLAEELAATKYDCRLQPHTTKLISLWNNLIRADQPRSQNTESTDSNAFPHDISSEIDDKSDIVSSRWSHIGFQGEDPGTDFRGMGILGLIQLEYLSTKPKKLARDLLKRSLIEESNYPFAIVGINITYNLLSLFRDGSMKHLYYDTGDKLFRHKEHSLKLFTLFNELYVELFLRFDCFWRESKPKNIFEFKSLMDKFVTIMRMDLRDRNFSLKFIY